MKPAGDPASADSFYRIAVIGLVSEALLCDFPSSSSLGNFVLGPGGIRSVMLGQ